MADDTRKSDPAETPETETGSSRSDTGKAPTGAASGDKTAASSAGTASKKTTGRKTGTGAASRAKTGSTSSRTRASGGAGGGRKTAAATKSASEARKTAVSTKKTGSDGAGYTAGSEAAGNEAKVSATDADATPRHWLKYLWRAIALIGFGVVSWLVLLAGWAISALQFVVNLVRDEPNAMLANLNRRLGIYLTEILAFMGGEQSIDTLPFPFSEFPGAESPDRDL